MTERLIDENGIVNTGALLRLHASWRRAPDFRYLCGVCFRQYVDEVDARACAESHPKDAPPTNEDR